MPNEKNDAGVSPPPTQEPSEREKQIKAQLAVEWRMKTEQGIHHDHLSDLAFLITELEFTRAKLAALSPPPQPTPSVKGRLQVIVERLAAWECKEDSDNQEAEELLLDIQQCLESILRSEVLSPPPTQEPERLYAIKKRLYQLADSVGSVVFAELATELDRGIAEVEARFREVSALSPHPPTAEEER